MKIINVTPGIIPIPPNGWGAVEKIIWEIHNNLLILGHDAHITYLDDIPADADIVHIHVANLALMAHERGIPYYFTCHDHHAYLYGKDSPVYKENLRAMQYAKKAFVPAKYLVDYFDGIPQYFSHGVNTLFFSPLRNRSEHKLLCVANNGYIHNQSEDRKGFGIAIKAAEILNIPITIAGPINNKNYFEQNPPTYEKLTILYNLTEEELREVYRSHTIFLHPSETEAGHPNLTMLEALACGLPIAGTLESNATLDGMIVTDRNVENLVAGIEQLITEYSRYQTDAINQANKLTWYRRTQELLDIYTTHTNVTMREQLVHHYKNTAPIKRVLPPKFTIHNIDGLFVEITGGPTTEYIVQLINKDTDAVAYEATIKNNSWVKSAAQYWVNWTVRITDVNSSVTYVYTPELVNNRVYICFESKSLGDTLAWIPYVEEFRKHHGCNVVCSTFWNELFTTTYPEITFVSPGTNVEDIVALYRVGLFYRDDGSVDYSKHPINPIQIPMQKIASDILGLQFSEIRPHVKTSNLPLRKKQVAIAVHSTAQAKYWNNPTGWQEVVDWLRAQGYEVKLLSAEGMEYMGNTAPQGVIPLPPSTIDAVIHELQASVAFIGISSGLSWLSWALKIPTVLISGFTDPITEIQDCYRVAAPVGSCNGCWNRHRFDPGDWNWCPDHKETSGQFQCSKNITSEMVITQLKAALNYP
jgi:autotransporter strand-loop-strand O-heptosyltransferase